MAKAEIINIEHKKEAQRDAEMNMTPQQRIDLVFQLMDLAIALSPNKKVESTQKDDFPWIELKLKNEIN